MLSVIPVPPNEGVSPGHQEFSGFWPIVCANALFSLLVFIHSLSCSTGPENSTKSCIIAKKNNFYGGSGEKVKYEAKAKGNINSDENGHQTVLYLC